MIGGLRRYRNIPQFQPPDQAAEGELVTIREAAEIPGMAPSTPHPWVKEGFITGEQVTPGAPWRIRMTEELKARFVAEAPAGYLPMLEATMKLGVSRQTVWQPVKRGELEALHIGGGRRKGLRIKVIDDQPDLFGGIS